MLSFFPTTCHIRLARYILKYLRGELDCMIKKIKFGSTGHCSSVIIFGGAALWRESKQKSLETLDLLLKYGVNHIDVAPRYGKAEVRIGEWMREHREKFFLATKTDKRNYQDARTELHRSLDRLNTDHVDLIQLHSLTNPDDWSQVFENGGALEALIEARNQGLTKFIGDTGHGWTAPAMHRWSLKKFAFDSVLMPWNFFAANHRGYDKEFFKTLSLCKKNNIAVQTIKSIAKGPWAAGVAPNRKTWYQPYENENSVRKCVHWVLSTPDIFLNSVGDVDLLPMVLDAAKSFVKAPTYQEMQQVSDEEGMASIFGI